jgi:hypothetical protein
MKNPVIEAGIPPVPEILLLRFYLEPIKREDDLLIIGDDERTNLALHPHGKIISIDQTTGKLIRFVNSDPTSMAGCIHAFHRYLESIRNCFSDAEEKECVKHLKQEVAGLDPPALSDPNSWWSCVIEQAHDGML